MTDKELLELAAKAVGIVGEYHSPTFGITYIAGSEDGTYTEKWNPLADNNAAFRLMVKLGICVFLYRHHSSEPETEAWHGDISAFEKHNNDPLAATRRAIVKAAAAIGEKK